MIVCPKCSKENQDHYKFCLGCGSELPRDGAAPQRSFSTPTPPAGIPVSQPLGAPRGEFFDPGSAFAATGQAPLPPPVAAAPAAPARPASGMRTCPSCGTENPPNFKFCGACGANMQAAGPPAHAAAAAPAAHAAPLPSADEQRAPGYLVLIRPDGSEGGAFPLQDGATSVGRSTGQLFAADAYLSPLHATFVMSGGALSVQDENSLNGVYVRIAAERPLQLQTSDVLRLGQELIIVEAMADPATSDDGTEVMGSNTDEVWGRVALVVGKGQVANTFNLAGDGVVLGRERGDVLFPEDGYVSGTHLRLQRHGSTISCTDLNSSNGTFLKVRGEQQLTAGDYILMGQQLFRVDF